MGKVIKELRSGQVKLVIWENEDEAGNKWNSINLNRIYKDSTGNWQDTQSFKEKDLLNISALCQKAHEMLRIEERNPKNRSEANYSKQSSLSR